MSEQAGTVHARRFWKRLGLAAVILAVGLGGVGYGFLLHSRRIFPYALLKRGFHVFERRRSNLHQRHIRGTAGKAQASPEDIRRLANIPYLQGYQPATDSGVVRIYDASACQKGLNFFTSGHGPVATLMDMNGKVVKTWSIDPEKAFTGPIEKHHSHEHFLRDASLMPDGGIVAMFDQIGLVRLDADSRPALGLAGAGAPRSLCRRHGKDLDAPSRKASRSRAAPRRARPGGFSGRVVAPRAGLAASFARGMLSAVSICSASSQCAAREGRRLSQLTAWPFWMEAWRPALRRFDAGTSWSPSRH